MSDITRKNTKRERTALSVRDAEVVGRLQPQAVYMEEAVLGAMMLDRNAIMQVIEMLRVETFYDERHQLVFQAVKNLVDRTEPVDILTVTAELRKMGMLEAVGGAYYVTTLTNRVSSAAHVEYHAHIITQKYLQRELIRVTNELNRDAYEETTDVFELLDKAEDRIFKIKDGSIKRNYLGISDVLNKAIKQIESLKDHQDGLTGIPSGLLALDRLTSGWQKSDLVILAARPGMGKTAFVLSIARNAAVQFQKGVAIFSLEMSAVQLVTRLIAGEAELESEKLKKGNLADYEWQQLNSRVRALSEAPIFIDDTPALSVFELRTKCRRLKSNHNIELIIVDYLQLMRGEGDNAKGGNREQEISYISRSLKGLAKDLDVPVIALSQLSREVEKRPDKKPMLSDLRESGSIEQDADMVAFIYRPEYYNITQDADGNDTHGIADIIIAKHRNGPTDSARVKFISHFAKFADLGASDFNFSFDNNDGGGAGVTGSQTITYESKINRDDFSFEEDAPF